MAGEGTRRTGRPRKAEARTRQVHLRLTEREHADLMAAAATAGTTVTDYVLANTIRDAGAFCPDAGMLRKAYFELNRQGTNLNQIAAALNRIAASAAVEDGGSARIFAELAERAERLIDENAGGIRLATRSILRTVAGTRGGRD